MKVKATAVGYFGQIREIDDEFDVPDDTEMKDAWFVQVAERVEPVDEHRPTGRRGRHAGPGADEPHSI